MKPEAWREGREQPIWKRVGVWAELCLCGVAVAREAVGRPGEAARRCVVAADAEAYRADDPETIEVDETVEPGGGAGPVSRPVVRRSPNAQPMKEWGRGEADRAGGRGHWFRCYAG